MINGSIFEDIISKAKGYTYSSFNYIDYDGCKFSEIISIENDVILLLDKTKNPAMVHFATNDYMILLNKIENIEGSIKINFVEHKYRTDLENMGFITYAEYIDFFCYDLNGVNVENDNYDNIIFSNSNECKKLSILSKKCSGSSRGFSGESIEWFSEWMAENSVIIVNDDKKNIIGFCCVAIYSNGSNLWIRELAVDPKYQGQGFGKKLIEQAICYGRNKGAVKGFLAVDIKNEKAIHIYKKYNFTNKCNIGELQMVRL
jgi:ribosomal protein S18 acetylase RimI-like enzyme